jgi:hypothetical protein
MNKKGITDTLATIASTRNRLRDEMRRADGDKARAEVRLADLTAIDTMAAAYADDLRTQLQAIEAAEEQAAVPRS